MYTTVIALWRGPDAPHMDAPWNFLSFSLVQSLLLYLFVRYGSNTMAWKQENLREESFLFLCSNIINSMKIFIIVQTCLVRFNACSMHIIVCLGIGEGISQGGIRCVPWNSLMAHNYDLNLALKKANVCALKLNIFAWGIEGGEGREVALPPTICLVCL